MTTYQIDPQDALAASVSADYTTTGHDHPQTSHEAARTVVVQSGTQRCRVLATLAGRPCTDPEVSSILDMSPNSERPRRRELVQAGLVEGLRDEQDNVVTRMHYGSAHIVWTVTAAGREALATIGG